MPLSPDPIQALGRLLGRLLPISLAEVLKRAPDQLMVGRLAHGTVVRIRGRRQLTRDLGVGARELVGYPLAAGSVATRRAPSLADLWS